MSTPPSPNARLTAFFRTASPLDWVAAGIVGLYIVVWIGSALGYTLPHIGFLAMLALLALGYLVVRVTIQIRKVLLWRLRNRLIVAYLLMAVVPILLLVTMVGLAIYLLELQIGAHLLRDDLKQRANMISADAKEIAGVVGRETDLKPAPPQVFGRGRGGFGGGRGNFGGQSGRGNPAGAQGGPAPQAARGGQNGQPAPQPNPGPPRACPTANPEEEQILTRSSIAGVIAAAQADWPDLCVRLNIGTDLVRDKAAGRFDGLAELGNRLMFAAVETLPIAGGNNTIFVAAPVTGDLLDSFPSKLGPIQLSLLTPVTGNPANGGQGRGFNGPTLSRGNTPAPSGAQPGPVGPGGGFRGRGGPPPGPRQTFPIGDTTYYIGQQISTSKRAVTPRRFWGDITVTGVATFDALRAQPRTGSGTDLPVLVRYSFRLSDVNGDLLTSVGDLAPTIESILFVALIIFILLELVALATGFMLTRTITHSVANLYDATLRIRSGDFAHRIHVQRRDQLGALAESFNEMTGSVAELIDEQRQRQRLENEVSIAREVQLQLFPKKLPSIPGLELAAICRPARDVSGDYYDIIPLDSTRVGIALADISGKGIFASLLMASLQAALRSATSMSGNLDTARIVARLNQHLLQTTSDDRYATLFYAVYDTQTRMLTYTNAGHLPPLLITDGRVQTLTEGGTVIGLLEDATYSQGTVEIPPGSLLLAFSDGLTEPENVFGEEFGVARLREEALRERNVPARKLAEDLIDTAEHWSGTPEQADDMTVVIARMT